LYPPKHHQESHTDLIKEVAAQYPLATIVSAHGELPYITHAPLIFHGDKLVGHIDASNPHVGLLKNNHPITLVFQGPQTYISPKIYTTTQLPTWNYIIAHAKGTVREINAAQMIKQSMVSMTSYLEGTDEPFVLDIKDPRLDRLIPYVHCFEIEITHWEGKFKLSQDKSPQDIENAKQELIANHQKNMESFINRLFLQTDTLPH
jgi:transcriptional regulator